MQFRETLKLMLIDLFGDNVKRKFKLYDRVIVIDDAAKFNGVVHDVRFRSASKEWQYFINCSQFSDFTGWYRESVIKKGWTFNNEEYRLINAAFQFATLTFILCMFASYPVLLEYQLNVAKFQADRLEAIIRNLETGQLGQKNIDQDGITDTEVEK